MSDEKKVEKKDYEKFYLAIKSFVRNQGRSNIIIKSRIQEVIDEFEEEENGNKKT